LLKLLAFTSIAKPELVRVLVVIDGAITDTAVTVARLLKLLPFTSIAKPELVRVLVVMDGAMSD